MVASQNGWVANDPGVLDRSATADATGIRFPGGVRHDAPGQLLMAVAGRFHREVEQLVDGWCWGYAEREIRGGGSLSNHASGTAIDCNAPRHPLGKAGTFSGSQVAAIRQILADTNHVVRWGGDYSGRVDEMHFEITTGATMRQCEDALAAIRSKEGGMSKQDALAAEREYWNSEWHEIEVPGGTRRVSLRDSILRIREVVAAIVYGQWSNAEGNGYTLPEYVVGSNDRLVETQDQLTRVERKLDELLAEQKQKGE